MPEGGPLHWVQQNRARRERATAIGKLTSAWVARVCNDWAALRRPAEVIATIVMMNSVRCAGWHEIQSEAE